MGPLVPPESESTYITRRGRLRSSVSVAGEAFTWACAQIPPPPRDADMDVPEGLGLTLMRNFASQLGGHLACSPTNGPAANALFPDCTASLETADRYFPSLALWSAPAFL